MVLSAYCKAIKTWNVSPSWCAQALNVMAIQC